MIRVEYIHLFEILPYEIKQFKKKLIKYVYKFFLFNQCNDKCITCYELYSITKLHSVSKLNLVVLKLIRVLESIFDLRGPW